MSHVPHQVPAVPHWHRVDVCCHDALARTRVSMIGALDVEAVEEIDSAVRTAEAQEHSLILDLDGVSSVTPQALREVLARGSRPRAVAPLTV